VLNEAEFRNAAEHNATRSLLLKMERTYGRCLGQMEAGHSFGELSLITGGERQATVVALTPATLLMVTKKDYEATLAAKQASELHARVSFLLSVPALQTWNSQKLNKLAYQFRVVKFERNHQIITEGSSPSNLYIIKSGECIASKRVPEDLREQGASDPAAPDGSPGQQLKGISYATRSKSGRVRGGAESSHPRSGRWHSGRSLPENIPLRTIGTGQMYGEWALLGQKRLQPCTLTATMPTEAFTVNGDDFVRLLQGFGVDGNSVLESIAAVADRKHEMEQQTLASATETWRHVLNVRHVRRLPALQRGWLADAGSRRGGSRSPSPGLGERASLGPSPVPVSASPSPASSFNDDSALDEGGPSPSFPAPARGQSPMRLVPTRGGPALSPSPSPPPPSKPIDLAGGVVTEERLAESLSISPLLARLTMQMLYGDENAARGSTTASPEPLPPSILEDVMEEMSAEQNSSLKFWSGGGRRDAGNDNGGSGDQVTFSSSPSSDAAVLAQIAEGMRMAAPSPLRGRGSPTRLKPLKGKPKQPESWLSLPGSNLSPEEEQEAKRAARLRASPTKTVLTYGELATCIESSSPAFRAGAAKPPTRFVAPASAANEGLAENSSAMSVSPALGASFVRAPAPVPAAVAEEEAPAAAAVVALAPGEAAPAVEAVEAAAAEAAATAEAVAAEAEAAEAAAPASLELAPSPETDVDESAPAPEDPAGAEPEGAAQEAEIDTA